MARVLLLVICNKDYHILHEVMWYLQTFTASKRKKEDESKFLLTFPLKHICKLSIFISFSSRFMIAGGSDAKAGFHLQLNKKNKEESNM